MMDSPKAPQDIELKNIIDKLAQFVARNGPDFEQMTKSKQKGNSKFAFLFGGEYYDYYQYKVQSEQGRLHTSPASTQSISMNTTNPGLAVWNMLQQQQQQQNAAALVSQHPSVSLPHTSVAATLLQTSAALQQAVLPQVTTNLAQVTSAVLPSVAATVLSPQVTLAAFPQGLTVESIKQQQAALQEQTSQSEQNLNAQHVVLMQQQQVAIEEAIRKAETERLQKDADLLGISFSEFNTILQPIVDTCTKDSISNGKAWILQKATSKQATATLVQYLLQKVMEPEKKFHQRLHIIYLVNDILHHCSRKHIPEFIQALESVVVPMFCLTSLGVTEEQQGKLSKLLNIWEMKNHYFSEDILKRLKDAVKSWQDYKESLLSKYPDIVTRLSNQTKTTFQGFQTQHVAFVHHTLQQIQTLEQQRLQLEEVQKQQAAAAQAAAAAAAIPPPPIEPPSRDHSGDEDGPPGVDRSEFPPSFKDRDKFRDRDSFSRDRDRVDDFGRSRSRDDYDRDKDDYGRDRDRELCRDRDDRDFPRDRDSRDPFSRDRDQYSSRSDRDDRESFNRDRDDREFNRDRDDREQFNRGDRDSRDSFSRDRDDREQFNRDRERNDFNRDRDEFRNRESFPRENFNSENSFNQSYEDSSYGNYNNRENYNSSYREGFNLREQFNESREFREFPPPPPPPNRSEQQFNNREFPANNNREWSQERTESQPTTPGPPGNNGMFPDLGINLNQPPPGFLYTPPPNIELPDVTRPPPGFPPVAPQQPDFQPEDLLPSLPYYDLPAGLMVPLVKLEDFKYKSLNPEDIRLPPPAPPSERLLAAVKLFYTPPGHNHPRDCDGWEKLGLYEYFKAKTDAKKKKETDIMEGLREKSRSPTPVRSFFAGDKTPPPKRRYSSRSRSRSRERSSNSRRRGRRDRDRSPRAEKAAPPSLLNMPLIAPPPGYPDSRRTPSPPTFGGAGLGSGTKPDLPEERLSESNKGHQLLKKMGWGGAGLGANEQGIEAPITGGEVREKADQYRGIGLNINDPYENFRKSKGQAFITRMKARAEERAERAAT